MTILSLDEFADHLAQVTLKAGYTIQKREKGVLFIEVGNGPFRCDLTRMYNIYIQNPTRLADFAKAHLSALKTTREANRPLTEEEADKALLPMLQTARWVKEVSKKAPPPVHRPFLHALKVTYVFEFPAQRAYANEQMLAPVLAEGGPEGVFTYALENLRQRTSHKDYAIHNTGPQKLVVCDKKDGFAATRVLLPDLMETWAKQFPENRMLLGIPNRDFLIAFSPADPKHIRAITQQIRKDARAQAHPLTHDLLLWEGGNLKEYSL